MSKNAIIGLTIALCVVAAGVGGFFATKMGTSEPVPAATLVGTTSADPARAASVPAEASSATEGAVPEPPAVVTPDPVQVPAETAPSQPVASATKSAEIRPAPAKHTPVSAPAAKQPATHAPAQPVDSSRTDLEKPWPSGAAGSGTAATEPPTTAAPPVEQQASQPPPPVTAPLPAPEPQFEELVVDADSVLGIKLDSTVNSETARVEDPVEAHVSRDVRVGSSVAIPAGSRVLGVVSQVERGGKMKNRARLGVRFHTLVLEDGTRTTIQTDAIFRDGEAPGQEAASKMGAAAAGGAILGAILGGGKGAAIGGSIGAAGGAAAVMAGDRNAAVLKAGTSLTVRLLRPVTVLVGR